MRFYEDPKKTSENRLPPRAHYIPAGDAEHISLNGKWRFLFLKNGEDYNEKTVLTDEIEVPSCWQLSGYESPNYTNINYPYPCDMPYVPDINPLGVYERDIVLEPSKKRTYLVLEGASSMAAIYLNGKYIGFTEGSHLMAEFDLTDHISGRKNTLRILVYKWCCGSYLEDQDMFRHNGLFRDVYLLRRPEGHLFDLDIRASADGILTVRADQPVTAELLDRGELVASGRGKNLKLRLTEPHLWNAEDPYLYTVSIKCAGELITERVGFRSISVSSKYELLINGTPVKLKGVNHHDTSPKGGFTMTGEELLRDLKLMKSLNINTVRTSHYPPSPALVKLCDELGFYVVLECDYEAHGFLRRHPNVPYKYDATLGEWPCSSKEWRREHIDRIARTYERDKNRPSVIMWSLGNESGYSEVCIDPMIEYIKKHDRERLVHFESASQSKDGLHKVDVYSMMYPSIERVISDLENKDYKMPVFHCEYAHAMGNGPGDISHYVDLMHKYPNYIGGCVWEWADHVVYKNGTPCYGGDFDELTHDGNFCCDGLVFHDRSLKAGSLEVRTVYAPIKFEYNKGRIKLTNLYDFTDLRERRLIYRIRVDERTVEKKELSIALAPKKYTYIEPETDIGSLECQFFAALDVELLSMSGERIAELSSELPVKKSDTDLIKDRNVPSARLRELGRYIIAEGEGFEYRFNKQTGTLDSMSVNGEELLLAPVKLSAYRAPTDNDKKMVPLWAKTNEWQGENLDCVFNKTYSAELTDGIIVFKCSLGGISRLPFLKYTLRLRVYADGGIYFDLSGRVREDAPWLPRLGFEFKLDKRHKQFAYFGMGPYENYPDMCHHVRLGHHCSDVDREYVPYVMPQEHGNHMGMRMLSVAPLLFGSDKPIAFNVSKYSIEELTAARHTTELPYSSATHIRIDYKVSGLGSASCGPDLRPEYRLSEKKIDLAFIVIPSIPKKQKTTEK